MVGAIGSAAPWFLTRCEPRGAFRVADLLTPAGISGLLSPVPARIGHRVPGTVL